MSFRETTRLAGFILLVGLVLIISGCAGAAATAQPPVNPTVVIVQYVTQVVATVTPAPPVPTPIPSTPKAPAPSGFDPYSVEPYYPIAGCQMASRLKVGDIAYVAAGGDQQGIHISRDVGFSPLARKLISGERLFIVDTATCNKNGLVWKVLADADDTLGFAIEGDGNTYYLIPSGETFDAKEIRDRIKKLDQP